ncbi:TonB-dependent receptor [Asticcacaulis sp. BYS171W]|uniref:TonB-dependent receptor n=1 Tax=Asticcacaulis aquaticus TaxID=2984212 RepID=A0ABT5HVR9_9CAUL|nr:TonB-dependent receptor [Asticcacaulis aquaticus]MDC7684181.1 TonB-dependent receptor [Asticcacaulis aquaticus]
MLTQNPPHRRRSALTGASIVAICLAIGAPALAQETTAANDDTTTVVVTGYRQSLQQSLTQKKNSDALIDVITAEDVGKFPESNLAEALQRLPGISIERENGEGRTITVRGLGGDFVRTRLNGLETVAASGVNEGQTAVNRTRGFDYNVFASELFSSLSVRKSAEANEDEGSLGATVDIDTGRPLDMRYDKGKTHKVLFSAQDTYYDNGGEHNPRYAVLFAKKLMGGKLGFLFSGAYSKRDTGLSFYDRNPGQFEFYYRGSNHGTAKVQNGTGSPVAPVCSTTVNTVNATTNTSPLNCFYGFASPTPTSVSPAPSGIGTVANGISSASYMYGSDPVAWAKLNQNLITTMPSLASLQQQDIKQERLGLTFTTQWKPTDRTKITFDALYSEFIADNQSHILGSFGLNRHFFNDRAEIGLTNTTTGLRPYSTANNNYFADRRGVYGNRCDYNAVTNLCQGSLGDANKAVFSTTQYWNGTAYVPVAAVLNTATVAGNTWSTNPYNLDTYDYYNNPGSVGYSAAGAAADRRGILMYDQIIGKEAVLLRDVSINSANQVEYMKLDRVDWQTNDAYAKNETYFSQFGLTLDHRFSDKFVMQAVYGASYSQLKIDGGRTDIFALDKNGFVYDQRSTGDGMPVYNPGFNVADPNEYGDIVKGYASISRYVRSSINRYETLRADFKYDFNDRYRLDFGYSKRIYQFSTRAATVGRSVLPTIAELNKYGREQNKPEYANLKLGDLGSVVQFGAGLDLPAGVPTKWWSPDRDTMSRILGYECNCVNAFADWRLQTSLGDALTVKETDTSHYIQGTFNIDLFGRPLRGNTGVRVANTKVESASNGTSGVFSGTGFTGSNQYTDVLPSLNLTYEVVPDVFVRFAAAKTMARPSLGNLTPGVTGITLNAAPDSGANAPRLTIGNPKLSPFRSTNFDLNVEWYPTRDMLLSVAFFHKDMGSYPRQQSYYAKLNEFLPTETYSAVRAGLTTLTPVQAAYMDTGENVWNINTYVDSPGGIINGIELQYQQTFTFLPAPFNGLGIQANATKLESELNYLTQSGRWAAAPWPFASPQAVNLTVFYEKGRFEGRVAYSWRDRFASRFPQAEGTCSPGITTNAGGVCGAPYNDFLGTEAQQYVDLKLSYKFSDKLRGDFSIQNIMNEPEVQWLYEPSVVRKYSAGAGVIMTTGLRYTF